MKKLLNLGCGSRYSPAWTNVDVVSSSEHVVAHDLLKGIPFLDSEFDVVYHSHFLEHIPRNKVEAFVKECNRILKLGGVLRIVVPDLEKIVLAYLQAINKASDGSKEWQANYDWVLLEMYDQVIREKSGGLMAEYLADPSLENEEYILLRCGVEAKRIIQNARKAWSEKREARPDINRLMGMVKTLYRFVRYSPYRKEVVLRKMLGAEYAALQIGRFRQSGEVHQWMYDRYSLGRLMEMCGFQDIQQRTASDSYIDNWNSYFLDTEPDGSVYKPDSLYMEGIKR